MEEVLNVTTIHREVVVPTDSVSEGIASNCGGGPENSIELFVSDFLVLKE